MRIGYYAGEEGGARLAPPQPSGARDLPSEDECQGAFRRGFHQPGDHPGRHPGGDGRPLFGGRGGAPSTYPLEGELYPALLLLWQVQAYLVGYLNPDSRRSIPGCCPGLRVNGRPLQAFTMNQGPPPQVRQVVVVEGWTPEPPSDSPPKEASGEEAIYFFIIFNCLVLNLSH